MGYDSSRGGYRVSQLSNLKADIITKIMMLNDEQVQALISRLEQEEILKGGNDNEQEQQS